MVKCSLNDCLKIVCQSLYHVKDNWNSSLKKIRPYSTFINNMYLYLSYCKLTFLLTCKLLQLRVHLFNPHLFGKGGSRAHVDLK